MEEQIRDLIVKVLEERERDEREENNEYQEAFDNMMMKDVPPFPSLN